LAEALAHLLVVDAMRLSGDEVSVAGLNGLAFDLVELVQARLSSAVVDVRGCEIAQALLISPVTGLSRC
jgi:hypothetical protein